MLSFLWESFFNEELVMKIEPFLMGLVVTLAGSNAVSADWSERSGVISLVPEGDTVAVEVYSSTKFCADPVPTLAKASEGSRVFVLRMDSQKGRHQYALALMALSMGKQMRATFKGCDKDKRPLVDALAVYQ